MTKAATFSRILTAALWMSLLAGGSAHAGEAASAHSLKLQLNAVEPSQAGCRLTFVVENKLGGDLSKAAFEIAFFDAKGIVTRMTVLEFKNLPAGKTKVSRFDVAGAQCDAIGRVLVNDATECSGEGIDPLACLRGLVTETGAGLQFGS